MMRVGSFRKRAVAEWVVIASWTLGLVATACWFVMAARYALPVFDDFCRASLHPTTEFRPAVPSAGFWNALSWSYLNWSGRWAGTALGMLALGGVDVEAVYPAVLVTTMTVLVALTLLAARRFFGRHGLLMTGVLWLMWWSSNPAFSEVFFWSTTSIEAHAGIVAAALVWSYAVTSDLRRLRTKLLLAAGAFVVGGLHELAGILFSGCLAWRLLYLATANGASPRQKLRDWVWIAASGFAGTAVSVFAPGNSVRAEMYPASGAFVPSFIAAMVQVLTQAKSWLLADPRWWVASLIVITTIGLHRTQLRDAEPVERRTLLWTGAACLTTAGIGFLAPVLAQGGEMASRTIAQLFLFVLICWFGSMAAVAEAFLNEGEVAPKILNAVRAVSTCMFCVSVALDGNARLVRRERADGTLRSWNGEQLLRLRILRAAALREEQAVVLPPITTRSQVLPMVRDSSSPDYAHNLCLEWYYGIPRVTTEAGEGDAAPALPLAQPPATNPSLLPPVGIPPS